MSLILVVWSRSFPSQHRKRRLRTGWLVSLGISFTLENRPAFVVEGPQPAFVVAMGDATTRAAVPRVLVAPSRGAISSRRLPASRNHMSKKSHPSNLYSHSLMLPLSISLTILPGLTFHADVQVSPPPPTTHNDHIIASPMTWGVSLPRSDYASRQAVRNETETTLFHTYRIPVTLRALPPRSPTFLFWSHSALQPDLGERERQCACEKEAPALPSCVASPADDHGVETRPARHMHS